MKFSVKLILSIFFIGVVLSNKVMRITNTKTESKTNRKTNTKTNTKNYGSGTWATGYVCPEFFIQDGNSGFVNQGIAKIMAPQIENPTDDNNKLGLNLQFEKAPTANSLIAKVGTKINDKTYYIAYRHLQADMAYNNPVLQYKTLISSFVTDDRRKYSLKISLPYSTVSWIISDDEANKIKTLVNKQSIVARGNVSSNKSVIISNTENFISLSNLLAAANKNKAELDAALLAQKNKLNALNAELTANRELINAASTAFFNKQQELQQAAAKLQASNQAVSATSSRINNIQAQIKGLRSTADRSENLKTAQADLTNFTNLTNSQYEILRLEVSTHLADLSNSKAGLEAGDKVKFESGLNSSYPN